MNKLEFTVDGVKVVTNLDVSVDEAQNYIDYVRENVNRPEPLEEISVVLCTDGKVDVNYKLRGEKFERIRRITGKKIAVHNQAG